MATKQVFVDDYNGEIIDILGGDVIHQITINIDSMTHGNRTFTLDLGDASFEDFMDVSGRFIDASLEGDSTEADAAIDPSAIKIKNEKHAGTVPLLSTAQARRIKLNRHGVDRINSDLCTKLQGGGRVKIRTAVTRENARQLQLTAAKHGIQLTFAKTHRTESAAGNLTYFGDVYAETATV